MRIAHAVVTSAFAGTERYVVDVANNQSLQGDDVTVISGTEVRDRLLPTVRWLPGQNVPLAFSSAARVRVDIAHGHLTYGEFALTATRKLHRGSCVATRHLAVARGQSLMGRALRRVIEAGLDKQIAISSFVAQRLGGDLEVLHNGVANAPASNPHEPPVLLLAQRLEQEKATEVGLRAWLQSELPAAGWRLAVAGTGREAEQLLTLVSASAHADKVTFLGQVKDMDALYSRVDAVLASAPAEPLGLSVIEAMARALPVIATSGGGHLESLAAAPELLFAIGDPSAGARALNQLLDAGWRQELGRRLRESQQNSFEIGRHVARLREIYEALR